ncbi:LOW QUALITY PROTEIN: protein PTST, chloroplastic-like [Phragmites australis]|uniref:LOW QUALITY PROTEIN: protein PTST, chloroplastic-like n=1 Tax=Phragmites australis TaxID=29695 RepID=UPI002D78FE5B|nr:LOW QUALITY PROTEIN: protein PTST, chloroplastic-like [Phragmites australis]
MASSYCSQEYWSWVTVYWLALKLFVATVRSKVTLPDFLCVREPVPALVGLAEEIANSDVRSGSRKINGKYIQSYLLSRLEAVHDKVMEQIKDVDSLKPQEISVYWVGMAENVQIMGSFDGWSQGEALSMEYSGDYARFSATLNLRPGRYEIKFLVDGEWRLSPEYPNSGKGLTQNNILVIK